MPQSRLKSIVRTRSARRDETQRVAAGWEWSRQCLARFCHHLRPKNKIIENYLSFFLMTSYVGRPFWNLWKISAILERCR